LAFLVVLYEKWPFLTRKMGFLMPKMVFLAVFYILVLDCSHFL
jgi:hypothetical protein